MASDGNKDNSNPLAPRVHIHALPKEVLRNIFEYVYLLAYGEKDLDDDPTHLGWSPYFVFVICKTWHQVAKTLPLYAQRMMIHIDEPLSLPHLKEKILETKPRMIKVFIVRRNYPSDLSESSTVPLVADEIDTLSPQSVTEPIEVERSTIKSLIPLLSRHISRFQVLVFDLELRSSLPCLSLFRGYAARLRTLRLKSRTNDKMIRHLPSSPKLFRTTNLRYIDFDGALFVRAAQIPGWLESLRGLPQKQVSISNLFAGDCDGVDLYGLVECLSKDKIEHIFKLRLANILLNTTHCHNLSHFVIFIQVLEFHQVNYDNIVGFFAASTNHIRPNYITISDCLLEPLQPDSTGYFHLKSYRLTLKDIDAETSGESITAFVRNWDGFSLCFEGCPNVNDSLFDSLLTIDPTQAHEESCYIPSLREIAMNPYPNITAQPVKDFITARAQLAERHKIDGMESEIFRRVHAIWFIGYGPPLSDEDKAWFQAQPLNGFVWYTPKISSDGEVVPDPNAPELLTQLMTTPDFESTQAPPTQATNIFTAASSRPGVLPKPSNIQAVNHSTHREGSPVVDDDFANMSCEDFEAIARLMDCLS